MTEIPPVAGVTVRPAECNPTRGNGWPQEDTPCTVQSMRVGVPSNAVLVAQQPDTTTFLNGLCATTLYIGDIHVQYRWWEKCMLAEHVKWLNMHCISELVFLCKHLAYTTLIFLHILLSRACAERLNARQHCHTTGDAHQAKKKRIFLLHVEGELLWCGSWYMCSWKLVVIQ